MAAVISGIGVSPCVDARGPPRNRPNAKRLNSAPCACKLRKNDVEPTGYALNDLNSAHMLPQSFFAHAWRFGVEARVSCSKRVIATLTSWAKALRNGA